MNIDRYNYEEFFLLYIDNELNPAERRAVEAFVQENPDLEEELTMLKQSLLKPDESVVLEDKSVLFKEERNQLINVQNYETFFLLYVDDELSVDQRRAVESFASQHPAQQQELEVLMKTRVTSDTTVVFPNKQLLYREVVGGKVVVFKVWRVVAVAAMLIIAVGIYWLNSINTKTTGVASKEQEKKNSNIAQVAPDSNDAKKDQQQSSSIAEVKKESNQNEEAKLQQTDGKLNPDIIKEEKPRQLGYAKREEMEDTNKIIEYKSVQPSLIVKADDAIHTDIPVSTDFDKKTIIVDQAYGQTQSNQDVVLTKAENTEPDELAIGPVQTKNRFRGIFRQVTRVVEKNTHLPAGENKKLRIGNIQIALK
jgi:hypothetical protein